MEYKELKRIVDLFRRNELTELELETEACYLMLKKQADAAPVMVASSPSAQPVATPTSLPAASVPASGAPAPDADTGDSSDGTEMIYSPMVGTFYRSPSPDAGPFIKTGDTVEADTVVCIVEAMKVMNEIQAEKTGVIKEILVDNGDPVEYNQPLFKIQPA